MIISCVSRVILKVSLSLRVILNIGVILKFKTIFFKVKNHFQGRGRFFALGPHKRLESGFRAYEGQGHKGPQGLRSDEVYRG